MVCEGARELLSDLSVSWRGVRERGAGWGMQLRGRQEERQLQVCGLGAGALGLAGGGFQQGRGEP